MILSKATEFIPGLRGPNEARLCAGFGSLTMYLMCHNISFWLAYLLRHVYGHLGSHTVYVFVCIFVYSHVYSFCFLCCVECET